jgi:hypothetical protein
MKTWFTVLAAGLLFVILAAPASACLPVLVEITEYVWEPGAPVSFCIAPDREVRAYLRGGYQVTPELRCQVEVWPEWTNPELVFAEFIMIGQVDFCGGTYLFVPRGDDGSISVVPFMRGGGHRSPGASDVVSLRVQICPQQFLDLGRDVFFNSPDIDGNLRVDVGDLTLFARDFFSSYDYRSDFDWDDRVSLSDLAIMAQELGMSCR